MLRTTLRNLAAHKQRLVTTALAVILGVGFMAGTLVLTDTLQQTFDDLFTSVYDGTDAVVREQAAFKGTTPGSGDQRGRVDASLLDVVADVSGVAAAQGDVQGYAQLVDKAGDPVGDPLNGAPTFGGNWGAVDDLNPFALVSGRAPRRDEDVVIDKKSADDTGYRVGDTASVLVKGGPHAVRIAGIAKFGDADSPAGASFVLFTTPVAQELVAEPAKFDTISAVAEPGISQDELVRRIEARLPEGTEAVTGKAITKESTDNITEALSFFNNFVLVFAVIALLVGGFIIFNTFFITVAQRTRENALLRAIGASKRQILASVLLEALAVGLVASLVGVGAGVLVAAGLKILLAAFGFELPGGGVVITPSTIVISVVVGLVVTLVAALSPARKAGKVPPMAALRDVAVGSGGYGSKQRMVLGGVVLAAGVASLLVGLFGNAGSPLALVGLGALLVFFGVSVLGRTVALPLSRAIGAPLPRLRGVSGNLARENAMRNPKRTAATASALMIGVGLVGFITIFASSTKVSINRTIDQAFTGDFVITSGTQDGFGGLDPGLARALKELPEVEAATGTRAGLAEIDGSAHEVSAVDPTTGFDLIDVNPVAGSPDDLDANSLAVFEDVAKDKQLQVGERVPVEFKDTGRKQLTVALVYGENEQVGDWVLSIAGYEANFDDQYDFQVFVKKAPGVSASAALAAVERAAERYPGANVLDQSEYKADQTKEVNRMLGLVYAMLALSILIALLGIGNTLALSILERSRELGVLRAVGMTRDQLRSMVRWESVVIALQGTLLGLVVGVFFGWALVRALRDEGISTFSLPVPSLVVLVVLGGLAGVLAAALPARRAARLNVLEAIVTE